MVSFKLIFCSSESLLCVVFIINVYLEFRLSFTFNSKSKRKNKGSKLNERIKVVEKYMSIEQFE